MTHQTGPYDNLFLRNQDFDSSFRTFKLCFSFLFTSSYNLYSDTKDINPAGLRMCGEPFVSQGFAILKHLVSCKYEERRDVRIKQKSWRSCKSFDWATLRAPHDFWQEEKIDLHRLTFFDPWVAKFCTEWFY